MKVEVSACLVMLGGMQAVVIAADSTPALTGEIARSLHSCIVEPDRNRRLDCYDKAMQRPADRQTTPEQSFGLSATQVIEKEHITEAPKVMTSQVVAVSQLRGQPRTLTLANGQVWAEQNSDGRSVEIGVGGAITVTREVLGSFLLTSAASGHRSVRVKRVK